MHDNYKTYASLIGRTALMAMFIISGFGKLTHVQGTAAYIASVGLPLPVVAAIGAGVLELCGGLALVAGYRVRILGLALALFTLLASFLFHAYWAVPAAQMQVTQLLFMKNISVAGGLLLLSALGAGPLSLDAKARRE